MKKIIFLIISLLILVGCSNEVELSEKEMMEEGVVTDDKMLKVDKETMENLDFKYGGVLSAVDDSKSSGFVKADFIDNKYVMVATFENLPDPEGTDFYEGWVVRKGLKFNVISTGKAIKEGETYVNRYSSEEDLTDHLFYVLTIEPDDGDPAPAGHVLEGNLMVVT